MDIHTNDPLNEHLDVLAGIGGVSLDDQFYRRLQLKMELRKGIKERRAERTAVVTVGVLVILLTFNLIWLDSFDRRQSMVAPDGVAGFASYYDQQLSPDL